MPYSNRIYENIIEVTWMFDALEKCGKIKSFERLIEELPNGSDAIKDTIIQIAEDFEKEYPEDYDWNAADTEYFTEIAVYARRRLIGKFDGVGAGSFVKVISKTHYSDGTEYEHIDIGTNCIVKNVWPAPDGKIYYGLIPVDEFNNGQYWCCFYYAENEIEIIK